MSLSFNLCDLPIEMQKQVIKIFAEEDAQKRDLEKKNETFEQPKEKKSKYHAVKTKAVLDDGSVREFDSRKESNRYKELQLMQDCGEISGLEMQKEYELIPPQKLSTGRIERAVKYKADFVYEQDGETVVEDVKSPATRKLPVYIIKRKLMKYIYNIEIQEV